MQTLDATGWRVFEEHKIGNFYLDIYAEKENERVAFEVLVSKGTNNLPSINKVNFLRQENIKLILIDSFGNTMQKKMFLYNSFVKAISLYKKNKKISQIASITNLPYSMIFNWVKGNGYPDLNDKKITKQTKKMILNSKS